MHAASGIVGSVLVGGYGHRFAPRDLIGWGSVVAGAALALRYNLPSVALALAMSAVAGLTSVISSTGVETLAMQSVRDELRGRVFGSLNATLSLLSLAGAAVGGLAAEIVGIVPMLNVATALIVVAGIVVLRAYAARTDRVPA